MRKTNRKLLPLLLGMLLFLCMPLIHLQAAAEHPARLDDQAELPYSRRKAGDPDKTGYRQ